jgi:parallel beta helix pectate lyase-like protein
MYGATYYVATNGSDSNPGTAAQPFLTITRAYAAAAPGVEIVVMPGVYTDYTSGWGIHLGASGTASAPIVLRSQLPGAAIIDGQNLSDRNVAISIDGSYNVVSGFEIRNGTQGGISIWGNNNEILNCNIHNNGNPASTNPEGQDGIYSSEGTSGNIYAANQVHHNGRTGSNFDHGLYLCGQNEAVINNVILTNAASGLQIAGYITVSNLKVYNNVLAFNGTDGILLWQTLSGIDIKNNVLFRNGHYGLGSYQAHGSGVAVDHNLSFANGCGDFNFSGDGSDYSYTLGTAFYTDPRFINAAADAFDAHLTSGSPAISAALNLSSAFITDMSGADRSLSGPWDLGAFKYASSAGNSAIGLTIIKAQDGMHLTWNSELGKTYRVAYKNDLKSNWADLTGDLPATGSVMSWTDSSGTLPQRFYTVYSINNGLSAGNSAIRLAIVRAQDGMRLTWNSELGKTYRVAYKNDLKSHWADLTGDLLATGSVMSWTDSSGTLPQRFYTVYSIN